MEFKKPLPSFVFPDQPSPMPRIVFLCDDSKVAYEYSSAATGLISSSEFPSVAVSLLGKCADDAEYSERLDEIAQDWLNGVVIIFDRSDRESYLRIPFWHNIFLRACPTGRVAILMIDSPGKPRQVDSKDMVILSREMHYRYEIFRVSSSEDEDLLSAIHKASFGSQP
nr:hypothetical protein pmam_292 [Pithovirus mammoth]